MAKQTQKSTGDPASKMNPRGKIPAPVQYQIRPMLLPNVHWWSHRFLPPKKPRETIPAGYASLEIPAPMGLWFFGVYPKLSGNEQSIWRTGSNCLTL